MWPRLLFLAPYTSPAPTQKGSTCGNCKDYGGSSNDKRFAFWPKQNIHAAIKNLYTCEMLAGFMDAVNSHSHRPVGGLRSKHFATAPAKVLFSFSLVFCVALLFFFNIQSDSAAQRTASRLWSSALRLTGFSKIIKRKIHKKNCSLPRNYGTRLQEK